MFFVQKLPIIREPPWNASKLVEAAHLLPEVSRAASVLLCGLSCSQELVCLCSLCIADRLSFFAWSCRNWRIRSAPFWVATEYCRADWRNARADLNAVRNILAKLFLANAKATLDATPNGQGESDEKYNNNWEASLVMKLYANALHLDHNMCACVFTAWGYPSEAPARKGDNTPGFSVLRQPKQL